MSHERERTALELFAAACELDGAGVRRVLDEHCRDDADLRRRVEELLGFDKRGADADTRLARGVMSAVRESIATTGTDALPERLGRYRIVRKLGSGGMGVVYEALQENPHRSVALKVLRSVARDGRLARRLEREGEMLARLQHPGIAQIYETGTFESRDGEEPYLAMELVEGRDLVAYAHEHALDARARIELVVAICDAVAHAHERGVVHRDLKPANVLVDAHGRPRVLDFGVARLSEAEIDDPRAARAGASMATLVTQPGLIVGTLAYMSPEQIDAKPGSIDARADVYALGVITFELLAGRLPHVLDGLPVHEALRVVQIDEPRPIGAFDRALRGDVETIVAKALAKEPGARYAGARELAADLRRHLADEPIVARPPSAFYRVGKFARRNRAIVAGVSIAFVALAVGLVVSTKMYFDASDASERAQREAGRAKAVKSYVLDRILAGADPMQMGRDVKVVDLLDAAGEEIDSAFPDDPDLRAEALHVLGRSYLSLGLPKRSRELLERAADLRTRLLGVDAPETIESCHDLADSLTALGRMEEAHALYARTRRAAERTLGPDAPRTFSSLAGEIATIGALGRREEALAMCRAALARADEVLGPASQESLRLAWLACNALQNLGDVDEAAKLAVPRVAAAESALGADHPESVRARFQLALLRATQGRRDEAEPMLRRSLADYSRVYGNGVPKTFEVEVELANLLGEMERNDEAIALYRAAGDGFERTLGPDHRGTLTTRNNLAIQLRKSRRLHESEALAQVVLDDRVRVFGADSADAAESWNTLGAVHARMGEHARAARELDEALRIGRLVHGEEHPFLSTVRFNMACELQASDDHARAAPVFRDLLDRDARELGPDHTNTIGDGLQLARSLADLERYDEAESVAGAALEGARRALGERHVIALRLQGLLGRVRFACSAFDEADALLAGSIEGLRTIGRAEIAESEGSIAALARLRALRGARSP